MGYDRYDRGNSRGGNESGYGRRDDGRGFDQGRGTARDYGRQPQGYGSDDRGFFDRAGDEVRSWFGDEDAERRRRIDERYDEQSRYGEGSGDRDRYSSGRGLGRDEQGGSSWSANGRARDDDRTYGSGSSARYGQASYGGASGSQSSQNQGAWRRDEHPHDTHYRSWRDRQMESLDRDYEDYRRENQGRFESEFGNWRTQREGLRSQLREVTEHQEVVGSDGQHVGTVDHVQGDQIKLAKNDKDAAGQHHFVPLSWISSVSDKVTLSKSAAEAKQHWTDEARNAGSSMFGSDERSRDDGDQGSARNLNRSFPGTY